MMCLPNARIKYGFVITPSVITVDCRDIEPIKHELLVYVADNVGAMPALKLHEFVLSPIDESEEISRDEVITVIREFLDSIGEVRNFAVVTRGDVIVVRSVSGRPIERDRVAGSPEGMFSCDHCGFVTRYEIEYHNHVKIHYL